MQTAELGIKVDTREVTDATEALKALATAAERARTALDNLGKHKHNGISIKVAGAVAVVDIAPSD